MPRTGRILVDDLVYHVLNRGKDRKAVFHSADDFKVFLALLKASKEKYKVDLLGYCLMPNHFHLVLQPTSGENLSIMMHRLGVGYTRHVRSSHGSGPLWQGRFKCFPIQTDEHFTTVLRYVEANPVRAELVEAAWRWPWSSHRERIGKGAGFLDPLPVELGDDWEEFVNTPLTAVELEKVRSRAKSQLPFGSEEWSKEVKGRLG